MFRKSSSSSKVKIEPPAAGKIETVIGPTASFRGTIQTDGSIRIDGIFEGSIETAGNLVIGEQAKIMAGISAHNVSVAGVVKGDVDANRVEVLETGHIWGDLTVNSFTLDDGGFLSGQVHMQTDLSPPMLEAPRDTEANSAADSEPLEGEIIKGEEG